jgi:alkyl sulfatase BDS1-like metallo-beta-lactamase superfamily hydrolase
VVVAHEALPARFDRYIFTAGYNEIVNQRQFGAPGLRWPTEYRYPDRTYRDALALEVGGVGFALHHSRGETDDHTWTWVPEKKVLCSGDLFIWASPNAGNPQKVQRYPREWAVALRAMVDLEPEVLLPGHGFPVLGAERVRQALTDTADLLDSLVDQTLALMNAGARLDEILHTVAAPAALLDRPYLRPVYDEPEFVVRNIWRLYGGWWDGNPATLKPAAETDLARELAELAGGPGRLADRALALAEGTGTDQSRDGARSGDGALRLAAHLAELAALAAPTDPGVHRVRARVFTRCAQAATSTMAKGVFNWAARESDRPLDGSSEDGR